MFVAKAQPEDALGAYRRALDINPSNVDVLNNIGNALTRLNRIGEALEYLRRALTLDPSYPDAHYNLAHALVAGGQLPEAVAHYRTALTLRPDWPQVRAEFDALLADHPELGAATAR